MTAATVLVLRVCQADGTSSRGFVWPTSGPVEAPDWTPEPVCGGGLHGWLWGVGDLSVASGVNDPRSRWLAVEVLASDVVDLGGKVKFPRGTVVFCGGRAEAATYVLTRAPAGTRTMFATASAGVGGTASADDGGVISILYWCPKRELYRRAVAEVGENGIEPGTAYVVEVVDGRAEFRRAVRR